MPKQFKIFLGLLIALVLLFMSPKIIGVLSFGGAVKAEPLSHASIMKGKPENFEEKLLETESKYEVKLSDQLKGLEARIAALELKGSESKAFQKCQDLSKDNLSKATMTKDANECTQLAKKILGEIEDNKNSISINDEKISSQQDILNNPDSTQEEKDEASDKIDELEAENKNLEDENEELEKKLDVISALLKIAAIVAYAYGYELLGSALWAASESFSSGKKTEGASGSSGGKGPNLNDNTPPSAETKAKMKELEENEGAVIIKTKSGGGNWFFVKTKTSLKVYEGDALRALVYLEKLTAKSATIKSISQINPNFFSEFTYKSCQIRFDQGSYEYYLSVASIDLPTDSCIASQRWVLEDDSQVEFRK